MAEAAGEGGAGSEGVGIEGWGAGTTTAGDVSASSMGGAVAMEAAAELGMGSGVEAGSPNAGVFGINGVPDALEFGSGAASATMGLPGGVDTGYAGGEPGRPDKGGGPSMEKPRAADMRDEALLGPADRRRRVAQRADSASVTLSDNEAYLLGGSSAKRKDARRTLLGS